MLNMAVCEAAQDAIYKPLAAWRVDSIWADNDTRRAMADRLHKSSGCGTFCAGKGEECRVHRAVGMEVCSQSDGHLLVSFSGCLDTGLWNYGKHTLEYFRLQG